MSVTTPPRSLSSTPPPAQPGPKTPERPRGIPSHSVVGSTPLPLGASIRQKVEGDTDRVEKYKRADYDTYIHEDLRSRVFVDFEVFMKRVLHVPEEWRTDWGPAIKAVKENKEFKKHHKKYCGHCENRHSLESALYEPLMDLANTVLKVLSKPGFEGISRETTHRYRVNDPKKLRGGIFNNSDLSPDLIALHNGCDEEDSLHWANPLHILEVKPHNNALCDGKDMPRLVVDGTDPILNHAFPLNSRKRPANEADEPETVKKQRTSILTQVPGSGASAQAVGEGGGSSTAKPENQNQVDLATQACRYLLEMFSVPLLRSHATISLVDCDRLQLYHANRSVILVSSAIRFSGGQGLDKFIAIIIAFHCLSFDKNGILDSLVEGNSTLVKNPDISKDNKAVQLGNKLKFKLEDDGGEMKIQSDAKELQDGAEKAQGGAKKTQDDTEKTQDGVEKIKDDAEKTFVVTLGDVISRDPATVGRSTVVLAATSEQWPDTDLAVKISWPGSGRSPETDFLKEANDMAEKSDGKWATKHLPRVFYSVDVVFDEHSALNSVASLFEDASYVDEKYVYERRTLRIIIQERLYPLKSLTNVRDIGQVMLDVGCVHRWLYDVPGILHRDLSLHNIMCRLVMEMNARGKQEQKVYGVLTDYDLSSWKKHLQGDYTSTSRQRTGTPPYMAQELLKGTSPIHLYRHDVESLFYIMLLLGARHTFGLGTDKKVRVVMREGVPPYQKWFNGKDYETLGSIKADFFSDQPPIELSPAFEDFRPWLERLSYYFSEGFGELAIQKRRGKVWSWGREEAGAAGVTPAPVPFDNETLGGNIDYSTLIKPIRHLEGELSRLIIRYHPALPSLPTPAGSVQANT